jgi:ABC-2 type transport system ATP-binding protein
MTIEIFVENLTKKYHSQSSGMMALRGINLSIPSGQLFGLVGPDGAGKTTLLRILSTVINASNGKAEIAGLDVLTQAEPVRRLIGYMPQSYSLYGDLTVEENLKFFADLYAVPRSVLTERMNVLLDMARLQDFRKKRSMHLSGGMKKKLALACAMIHEPRVLLLDEPTTGVDPVSRRELWKLLNQVIRTGLTVLVSTPYMDEAERCHQVGMLLDGCILSIGKPAELEAQYPYQMVEVKARPRKVMREVVAQSREVISWRPVGDRVRIAAVDGETYIKRLKKDLRKAQAEILLLRMARIGMEDVFIHLAQGRE